MVPGRCDFRPDRNREVAAMHEDETESRLTRWSRLKRQTAAPDDSAPASTGHEAEGTEETDSDALHRLGLPEPETLTEGDDFAAYLGPDLPATLRRRALRALWKADPALTRPDGLVDYDDDYSDAATVPDQLRTAWKIGRGLVTREEEGPPREERAEPGVTAVPAPSEPAAEEIDEQPAAHQEACEEAGRVRPAPRRMRFVPPGEPGT